MDDLSNVGILFLIFAVLLVLYGTALSRTGNKELLPLHVVHSIRNKEDVRHVGRITIIVGCVIGAIAALLVVMGGAL